jgi:hypothetical protein
LVAQDQGVEHGLSRDSTKAVAISLTDRAAIALPTSAALTIGRCVSTLLSAHDLAVTNDG